MLEIAFTIAMAVAITGVLVNEIYAHRLKVSPVPTLPWTRTQILALMDEYMTDDVMSVYELGSGWGGMAKRIARRFPKLRVVGIELSPLPYIVSKFNMRRNLTFKRANALNVDLSGADMLALYLTRDILAQFKPKFEAELKPGTIVIASGFEIEGWQAIKKAPMKGALEKDIFVYRA